ncbi:MAG: sulfotransferase domain-containing protein, partial [Gloeomargaritaceae cyanobacterium C42_A2020_066]|nr:sulfotransferase domain-containing protein [Gloeomargaritaceae cyanobacterium C42_A2020_066]
MEIPGKQSPIPDVPIIWVASYPKSGNTWVRFLIFSLIFDCIDPDRVNDVIPDLNGFYMGNTENIDALGGFERPWLIKTHFCFLESLPGFHNTVGSIYIVRNPIDVLFLNLNYQLILQAEQMNLSVYEVEDFSQEYIHNFLEQGGDTRWMAHGFGTWSQNYLSWVEGLDNFPRLVVRYEDLILQPVTELRRLADYLDIATTSESLEETLRRCSFESMRAME